MDREPGLRERKKRATRAAMGEAALRLALAEGLPAVTPERIADAVQVSPRTFRNYFCSIEEAVVDGLHHRSLALVDALRARPPGEPVWDALTELVPQVISEIAGERTQAAGLFSLFRQSRSLAAEHLVAFEDVDVRLAAVIAERIGDPGAGPAVAGLVAGSVMTAVKVSVGLWARGYGASLPDLVRECLAQLRAGLPAAQMPPPEPQAVPPPVPPPDPPPAPASPG